MPATLDSISTREFALLPPSLAQADSSDTMEFAILSAPLEPALKETSAREPALPVPGLITVDATELAQPNSPLLMLVLMYALQEPHLLTEFARLFHKPALQDSIGMEPHHLAKPAPILALNALWQPLIVLFAQLALL